MRCKLDILNQQMTKWATRPRDDLRIVPPASNRLASTIESEIDGLDSITRKGLVGDHVEIRDRMDELLAFQAWSDLASKFSELHPAVVRAHVIVQNYMCFVYLGEALFKNLAKVAGPDTCTRKCCRFLINDEVRAFRNAMAHGNWRYQSDFGGLEFWARKGADPNEPMTRFEVRQNDLSFWQAAFAMYRLRYISEPHQIAGRHDFR